MPLTPPSSLTSFGHNRSHALDWLPLRHLKLLTDLHVALISVSSSFFQALTALPCLQLLDLSTALVSDWPALPTFVCSSRPLRSLLLPMRAIVSIADVAIDCAMQGMVRAGDRMECLQAANWFTLLSPTFGRS